MASFVAMCLFGGIVTVIFFMIVGMVRYFSDCKESHWLTSSISILGISLSLVYTVNIFI